MAETTRGYNPVSRPNPEVASRPTGVLAQFDGSIRPDVDTDEAGENRRTASSPSYGEDQVK